MLPRQGAFLLLAGSATADLASIQGVLDTINAGLLNLDKAVLGLPATAGVLQTLGASAVPLLENATQIILQSAPLTINEALSLGTSTAALRQNSNLTINDFIAQRAFFESTNSTGNILQGLAADKEASVALGQSLVSKLPDLSQIPGAQEMVNGAVMDLSSIYDRGIALFTNPALATGVGPAPTLSSPPSPSDLTPVSLPAPQAANVLSSSGTLNADGSCNCAVQCPAGSLGMDVTMQMLPGSTSTGSGMQALKPLGG